MADKDKNNSGRVLKRTYVHGILEAKYVGFVKPKMSTSHLDSYYRLELTEAKVFVKEVIGWDDPLPIDFVHLAAFAHALPANTAFFWKDEYADKISLAAPDTVYSIRLHSPMVADVQLQDTMVEDGMVFGTMTCAIRGYILHEEALSTTEVRGSNVSTTAHRYPDEIVTRADGDTKDDDDDEVKEGDGCMPFIGCYWILFFLIILFFLGIFGVSFYYFPKVSLSIVGIILFFALIAWLYGYLLRLPETDKVGCLPAGCLPAGCLPAGCLPVGCLPVGLLQVGCLSVAAILPMLFLLFLLGLSLYHNPLETIKLLAMMGAASIIWWIWERLRLLITALLYFIFGIYFLFGLVSGIFSAADQGSVVPRMVQRDLPEERSNIMPLPIAPGTTPDAVDVGDTLPTDSLLTDAAPEDSIITHTRLWSGYNGESYGGHFQILQSDINRAKALRSAVANQFEHATMLELLLLNDTARLTGLYTVFDSLRIAHDLDTLLFAEMVVSCIQDIPYTLLLPGPCDAVGGRRLSADMQEYLANGGRCRPYIEGGIFTPVEFMGSMEGDCDTRSLLLYTVLHHYGYDVALLASYTLQHAVLAINLPYPGTAYEIPGKRYVLWETTSVGFRPGVVPGAMRNMRLWEPLLISRKEHL